MTTARRSDGRRFRPITDESLSKTFITALLLTGSAEGAEAAVLEGIKVMKGDNASSEALLRGTITASIAARIPRQRVEHQERTASLLPIELRPVLRLSQKFRRVFVLRVLVGLSREVCARMLQTEIHQIDKRVCVSARELARCECVRSDSGGPIDNYFRSPSI